MSDRIRLRKKAALRKVFHFGAQILYTLLGPLYMGWFFYGFFDLGLVTVDQSMALQGRVTKCEVNRQHFNWYLNGKSTRYNFWLFEPGNLVTKQLITADSLKFMSDVRGGFRFYNTLGFYLERGALLRKEANSPYVVVKQNHQITRWKYRPLPEERAE